MALWGGRFEKGVDAFTQEFGASLDDDKAMAQEDVRGSRAHAKMLAKQGIISGEDAAAIDAGLERISEQIADGTFAWDVNDEDVHMAVEKALTADVGAPGARLHTGRSRNDQVATDIRLYAKRLCEELLEGNMELRRTFLGVAEKNLGV
ncbi:MAG: lyase family protein, partial [Coriobacteriaceae bacterium]|nr:lyase family protein [Coriobacteriaceae bacterium]